MAKKNNVDKLPPLELLELNIGEEKEEVVNTNLPELNLPELDMLKKKDQSTPSIPEVIPEQIQTQEGFVGFSTQPGESPVVLPTQESQLTTEFKLTSLTTEEEELFQEWRKSLPDNLQEDSDLYDLRGAWKGGLEPELYEDGTYHLGSRDPKTGLLLKSSKHPTFNKLVEGERNAGYEIYKGKDGRFYSKEKQPDYISNLQSKFTTGVTSDKDKETINKSVLETENWYKERGGMTPFKKMDEFNKKMSVYLESQKETVNNLPNTEEAINRYNQTVLSQASQFANELGLLIDNEGNISPLPNELESYTDRYSRFVEQNTPEEAEKTFGANLRDRFFAAVQETNANLSDLMGIGLGFNLLPGYKESNEYQRYEAELLRNQSTKYDRTIQDYIQAGEFGKAAGATATSVTEAIPAMIPAILNPEYGVYVMGATSGVQKYREIEDADIPKWKKLYLAGVTGLNEAIFERAFTTPILMKSKKAVMEMGEQQFKNNIKKNTEKALIDQVERTTKTTVPDFVKEGLSEVATGISNDIADKTLIDPTVKIGSHAIDDMIVGMAMGKIMSAPTDIVGAINREQAKKIAQKALEQIPDNINTDIKSDLVEKVAERDILTEKENKLAPEFQGKNQEQIDKLNAEIRDIAEETTGKPVEEIVEEKVEPKIKEDAKEAEVLREQVKEEGISEQEGVSDMREIDRTETTQEVIQEEKVAKPVKETIKEAVKTEEPTVEAVKEEVAVEEKPVEEIKAEEITDETVKEPVIKETEIVEPTKEYTSITQKLESIPEGEKVSEVGKEYIKIQDKLTPQEQADFKQALKVKQEVYKQSQQQKLEIKNKEADDVLSQGLDDLASFLGAKKEVTGEESPKVNDAIRNIAKGVSLKLEVKGEELIQAVRDYLTERKYQISDADIRKALADVKEFNVSREKVRGELIEDILEEEIKPLEPKITPESKEKVKEISEVQKEKKEPVVEDKGVKTKERKIGQRLLESDKVRKEVKAGIKEQGIDYIPKGLDLTQSESKALFDTYVEEGSVELAEKNIRDTKNDIKPDVRTYMAYLLYDKYDRQAQKAEGVEKGKLNAKAVDVALFAAEFATEAGRTVNAQKIWKKMIGSPEQLVTAAKKQIDKENQNAANNSKQNIKDAFNILNDFLSKEDIEKLINEEVNKRAESWLGKKEIDNINNFFDKLKIDTKNTMFDATLGIPVAIYNGAVEVMRQATLLGVNVGNIVKAGVDHINSKLKEEGYDIKLDQKAFKDEWTPKIESVVPKDKKPTTKPNLKATQQGKKRRASKITLKEQQINSILDALEKKGIDIRRGELKDIINDAINKIAETGELSESDFAEIYRKSLGIKQLSEADMVKLKEMGETVGKSDKAADDYIDTAEKYTNKIKELREEKDPGKRAELKKELDELAQELNEKKNTWKKALKEAQKTGRKIDEYFADQRTVFGLLSTFIQGNLLTPASQVRNVVANAMWQPLRSVSTAIGSVIDSMVTYSWNTLANLDKYIDENKHPRLHRTFKKMNPMQKAVSWIAIQKGYLRGFPVGLKESLIEMVVGQTKQDLTRREIQRSLRPLKALARNLDMLQGKEKANAKEAFMNMMEGTLGIAPEIMFRLLGIGDKPFKRGAEQGILYEYAQLKDIKGEDFQELKAKVETGKIFNEEGGQELLAAMQYAGEKATYTQDNFILKGINKAVQSLTSQEKVAEFLDRFKMLKPLMRFLVTTQAPYVKIPTNILAESIGYAVPELMVGSSIYKALYKGDRKGAAVDMGKAMTGFMMQSAAIWLLMNGILDDEDPRKKGAKERGAFYEYFSGGKRINLSLLRRKLNNPEADNEWKQDDDTRTLSGFGIPSVLMGVYTKEFDGMTPEEVEQRRGMLQKLRYILPSITSRITGIGSETLEGTFAKGTLALLEAMRGDPDDQNRWLVNTARAMSSAVMPNTYAQVIKLQKEKLKNARVMDKDVNKWIKNTLKKNYLKEDGLPDLLNIWGEPVNAIPDGKDWKYLFFDITKQADYDVNKFGYPLFKLYREINKYKGKDEEIDTRMLPTLAPKKYNYEGVDIKLDEDMYYELSKLYGKYQKEEIEFEMDELNYIEDYESQEDVLKSLQKAYRQGVNSARDEFEDMYYDFLESKLDEAELKTETK